MLPAAALRTLCNSLQLDRCCVVILMQTWEPTFALVNRQHSLSSSSVCAGCRIDLMPPLIPECRYGTAWHRIPKHKKKQRERRKRQNTGKMSLTRSKSRETFVIQFKLRLTTRHGVISDERSIVCGEFCTRYAAAACDKWSLLRTQSNQHKKPSQASIAVVESCHSSRKSTEWNKSVLLFSSSSSLDSVCCWYSLFAWLGGKKCEIDKRKCEWWSWHYHDDEQIYTHYCRVLLSPLFAVNFIVNI